MSTREQWRASIRPRIEHAQETLKGIEPGDLAERCGGTVCDDGIKLSLFTTSLCISVPGFEVQSEEGVLCREETQLLILDYLTHRESTAPSPVTSPDWIGFQELPNGAFYVKAFRSYTSTVLLERLDGNTDRFSRACESFGGASFSLADASYSFRALPSVNLALVWWAGDEEFPAHANVLFDRAAAAALPVDGMAALGRLLCHGVLAAVDTEDQELPRTIDAAESTRSHNVEDHC